MANLPRHRSGHPSPPQPFLLLFMVLAIAAMLVGCGGGGDETAAGTGSRPSGTVAVDPGQGEEAGEHDGEKRPHAGQDDSGSTAAPASHDGGGAEDTPDNGDSAGSAPKTNPVGTKVGVRSGHCPTGVTREQCKALAEQPISSAPSHPVKSPEDCGKVMSQGACEEMFAAERASQGSAGASVDVEHCLEERSREQCEAQLAAQLEAQYAASKGE